MSFVPAGINPKIVLGVLPETIVSVRTRFARSQPTTRLGLTQIAWPDPSWSCWVDLGVLSARRATNTTLMP